MGVLDIYSLEEEDDLMKIARDMSSWRDHHGDMGDCYHGDKIRCYAYIRQNGFAIRSNSLITYCEANRQVSIKCFLPFSGYKINWGRVMETWYTKPKRRYTEEVFLSFSRYLEYCQTGPV